MTTSNEELRPIVEAATQGEWRAGGKANTGVYAGDDIICFVDSMDEFSREQERANSDFIATFNPAKVKAMLDQIDALTKENAQLHISLAGAVLHAEQGWQRYESANRMCMAQQKEIAALESVGVRP